MNLNECLSIKSCIELHENNNFDNIQLLRKIPRNEGYKEIITISNELLDQFKEKTLVYVVKISKINNLESVHPIYSGSNPFVEMKLVPQDRTFGEQLQKTSYKPLTTNPEWIPQERFMFYLSSSSSSSDNDTTNNKKNESDNPDPDNNNNNTDNNIPELQFTVYSLPSFTESSDQLKNLGTMTLFLNDVSNEETDYTLPLFDAVNGKLNGAEIKISIQCLPYSIANSYKEIIVYEYERWQPIFEWGNSYPGHLLPTDPGRWSDIWGIEFGNDLSHILEPTPEGWSDKHPFEVVSTPTNARGWEYAVDFNYSDWYPINGSQTYVRRRVWKKEIFDPKFYTLPSQENHQVHNNNNNNVNTNNSNSQKQENLIPDYIQNLVENSPFHIIYSIVSQFNTNSNTNEKQLNVNLMISLPLLTNHFNFSQIIDRLHLSKVDNYTKYASQMLQFVLLPSPPTSSSTSIEEISCELFYCGNILIGLESCLLKGDTLMFNSIVEDVIPSISSPKKSSNLTSNIPEETKTIEISTISVNNLKEHETIGKMDPFVEFDYCQSDTNYWSYQTVVNENHGTSSEWIINQCINLHLPTKLKNDVLRIRVKEKNNLKSDTLIGKVAIPIENLNNTQWSQHTVKIKDKKNKLAGNIILTYRFKHFIPPSPSQLRLQRLHHKIQNFQPISTNDIPLFVIQKNDINNSILNEEVLSELNIKYNVKSYLWEETNNNLSSTISESSPTPTSTISTISETIDITTPKNINNYQYTFFLFNEKKINDNFITLQNNYAIITDLVNELNK